MVNRKKSIIYLSLSLSLSLSDHPKLQNSMHQRLQNATTQGSSISPALRALITDGLSPSPSFSSHSWLTERTGPRPKACTARWRQQQSQKRYGRSRAAALAPSVIHAASITELSRRWSSSRRARSPRSQKAVSLSLSLSPSSSPSLPRAPSLSLARARALRTNSIRLSFSLSLSPERASIRAEFSLRERAWFLFLHPRVLAYIPIIRIHGARMCMGAGTRADVCVCTRMVVICYADGSGRVFRCGNRRDAGTLCAQASISTYVCTCIYDALDARNSCHFP